MTDEPYPEHAKLQRVKDQSEAIGEFLEWLNNHEPSLVLHEWRDDLTDSRPCEHRLPDPLNVYRKKDYAKDPASCPQCHGEGHYVVEVEEQYIPSRRTTEQLLAEYFEIDLKVLDKEKRAMLDEFRAANAKRAS